MRLALSGQLGEGGLTSERMFEVMDLCLQCKGCNGAGKDGSAAPLDLDALIEKLPPKFGDRISAWRDHPRVMALREDARIRLLRLVQRTAQWMSEGAVTEEGAVRLADWIEPLLRRESYLARMVRRLAGMTMAMLEVIVSS